MIISIFKESIEVCPLKHDESLVVSSVCIQSMFNPNQIQVILEMGLFYRTSIYKLTISSNAGAGFRGGESRGRREINKLEKFQCQPTEIISKSTTQ